MKYAALVSRSVTIPGDERSRLHPGHGYPEHTESFTDLVDFKDKEAMEAWVKDRTSRSSYYKNDFKLIRYEELAFETTVSVKVTP